MRELITSKIEEVRYNGGHSTRKPSTVTMAVPHKFAVQVADLIEEYEKQGIEPEEGLIRLDLVAHYADQETEDIDSTTEETPGESEPDDSEEVKQIIDDLAETVEVELDGTDMEEKEEAPSE